MGLDCNDPTIGDEIDLLGVFEKYGIDSLDRKKISRLLAEIQLRSWTAEMESDTTEKGAANTFREIDAIISQRYLTEIGSLRDEIETLKVEATVARREADLIIEKYVEKMAQWLIGHKEEANK